MNMLFSIKSKSSIFDNRRYSVINVVKIRNNSYIIRKNYFYTKTINKIMFFVFSDSFLYSR